MNSYQQHNVFLIGFSLVLLLLIIGVSIQPTLRARAQHQLMQGQISRAASASQELKSLQAQITQLNALSIAPYKRELLLEKLTGFCRDKGLLVTAFPQAERLQQDESTVITHQIEVQGDYEAMVQLVYLLEQEDRLGTVSSLQFFKHKSRENRKTYLRANIVLRNLES